MVILMLKILLQISEKVAYPDVVNVSSSSSNALVAGTVYKNANIEWFECLK